MNEHLKVLLTKPTQDSHDRGVRYLARRLRDSGLEVVFTNFLLVDDILTTALQEDVDVIGVSSSSGGHMPVMEVLMGNLASVGANDMLVIVGGIIPANDVKRLKALGIAEVFGPGTSAESIIQFIRRNVRPKSDAPV